MSDIAITQILAFASLVFTGILSYFMFRQKSASEMAVILANAASAAATAAAKKVEAVAVTAETAVVTAGVAVNKANTMRQENSERQDARTEMIAGIVAEVAEVKKVATETHVLVNGAMGGVLEIGLEAAQGRYDKDPTADNKGKLEAAQKRVAEHSAKEKIVEAKNAVTP